MAGAQYMLVYINIIAIHYSKIVILVCKSMHFGKKKRGKHGDTDD